MRLSNSNKEVKKNEEYIFAEKLKVYAWNYYFIFIYILKNHRLK